MFPVLCHSAYGRLVFCPFFRHRHAAWGDSCHRRLSAAAAVYRRLRGHWGECCRALACTHEDSIDLLKHEKKCLHLKLDQCICLIFLSLASAPLLLRMYDSPPNPFCIYARASSFSFLGIQLENPDMLRHIFWQMNEFAKRWTGQSFQSPMSFLSFPLHCLAVCSFHCGQLPAASIHHWLWTEFEVICRQASGYAGLAQPC